MCGINLRAESARVALVNSRSALTRRRPIQSFTLPISIVSLRRRRRQMILCYKQLQQPFIESPISFHLQFLVVLRRPQWQSLNLAFRRPFM